MELLDLHKNTLDFNTQVPAKSPSSTRGPRRRRGVCRRRGTTGPDPQAGQAGVQAHLGPTSGGLGSVGSWASTDGGAVAARPRLLEFRRKAAHGCAMCGTQSFSVTLGRCYECPLAWRGGGGTSSTMAARRRPRELGLR
jgi:ribosomal protein L37AE/L43A